MQSVIPPGPPERIRIAGKSQGFLGLAVCYDIDADGYILMRTAYQPSPKERAAIAAGANIIMEELGPPPITARKIFVGDVPTVEPIDG